MKQFPKKPVMLLIAVTLLLTFTVSGTVAFLAANTGELTNTFTPVQVDTKIEEGFKDGTKNSIKVLNKNLDTNIPVYVRVAVFGNWVDENGNIVEPWYGPVSHNDSWEYSGSFYYYKRVLEVGAYTDELLKTPITWDRKPEGAHHLEVSVVHQAIQAEPASAVIDAWGWTPPASSN